MILSKFDKFKEATWFRYTTTTCGEQSGIISVSEFTIEHNLCTFDVTTYSYTVSIITIHMPRVLTV